ncbi:MAG TPA: DUF4145 domain-containing protein [bacterium]|nr:DUF4145 domain-containing protein [bacterium]
MANEGWALLAALGLGYLVGKPPNPQAPQMARPRPLTPAEIQGLSKYHSGWSPFTEKFIKRRKKLDEFELVETVNALPEDIKAAYKDALNCYLFGQNLASTNMVCLTIEQIIRVAAGSDEGKLFEVIDTVCKEKNLSPHIQRDLHLLRQIRNIHSHYVEPLGELDLLKLFKTVGDLVKELKIGA